MAEKQFAIGSLVYQKSKGRTGRVKQVLNELDSTGSPLLQVDFGGRYETISRRYLELLPILSLRGAAFALPDVIQSLTLNNKAVIVIGALADLGGTASTETLKSTITDVVDLDWAKWWPKARKEAKNNPWISIRGKNEWSLNPIASVTSLSELASTVPSLANTPKTTKKPAPKSQRSLSADEISLFHLACRTLGLGDAQILELRRILERQRHPINTLGHVIAFASTEPIFHEALVTNLNSERYVREMVRGSEVLIPGTRTLSRRAIDNLENFIVTLTRLLDAHYRELHEDWVGIQAEIIGHLYNWAGALAKEARREPLFSAIRNLVETLLRTARHEGLSAIVNLLSDVNRVEKGQRAFWACVREHASTHSLIAIAIATDLRPEPSQRLLSVLSGTDPMDRLNPFVEGVSAWFGSLGLASLVAERSRLDPHCVLRGTAESNIVVPLLAYRSETTPLLVRHWLEQVCDQESTSILGVALNALIDDVRSTALNELKGTVEAKNRELQHQRERGDDLERRVRLLSQDLDELRLRRRFEDSQGGLMSRLPVLTSAVELVAKLKADPLSPSAISAHIESFLAKWRVVGEGVVGDTYPFAPERFILVGNPVPPGALARVVRSAYVHRTEQGEDVVLVRGVMVAQEVEA